MNMEQMNLPPDKNFGNNNYRAGFIDFYKFVKLNIPLLIKYFSSIKLPRPTLIKIVFFDKRHHADYPEILQEQNYLAHQNWQL